MRLDTQSILPADADCATLIGRAWVPGPLAGPSPVLIADAWVWDLARVAPTVSALLNCKDPVQLATDAMASGWAKPLGAIGDLVANTHADRRDPAKP